MEKLIARLRNDNPSLSFVKGELLCWSPQQKQIYYDPGAGDEGLYGVLHEVGHAHLSHDAYCSDVDLLKKESQAWHEALKQAAKYDIALNWEHIQDCLDSYRDWLYKRSTCPNCKAKGVQQTETTYYCINCKTGWQVTRSRFCRPYRRKK